MASRDRSPRLSEGRLDARNVEKVIVQLKIIQDNLQQMILRNRGYLNAAKARRSDYASNDGAE
jgi:isocitrate dehydrogenase